MRELPPAARVLLLAASGAILLAALTGAGTHDDPYASNEWLFSHAFLAEKSLEGGRLLQNHHLIESHTYGDSIDAFVEQTGLERLTLYAGTVWHFWNGLPLQPALLAGVSALTGLAPEEAARLPLAGLAVMLLVYAGADLLLPRDSRLAHVAPFALALCSSPFTLDMRTLMPPAAILVVALVLHFLLRRALTDDKHALAYSLVPLALLPFWYYTVSYFVILLFAGFLGAAIVMRLFRGDESPIVPMLVATLVPLALGSVLLLNGALTSQLEMAHHTATLPGFEAETGLDYDEHLNREGWRSALLYAQLGALFLPLAILAIHATVRLLRRQRVGPERAVFAQWAVGAMLFSGLLQSAVGVSFLSRPVIYLTPLAVLAALWAASQHRAARPLLAGAIALSVVVTPILVMTASPTYSQGDRVAFEWMDGHVAKDAIVYGSLDASSVLFRRYGYVDTLAFHPRQGVLEVLWYGNETEPLVPYLASVDWFVLRDDARTRGFEEFGPLREPIGDEAYAKFARSPDLHRVFDDGEVEIFQVGLAPARISG
ncbi:MAG TPA: hypothetical protein VM370_04615 [Candidatus Thermoplasmatota archaeon]|nr:hypothetical protein [Candidatus Thermoplasmatota archaeon]